jgi:hypothetical protein
MSVNYSWSITSLNCVEQENTLENVVKSIDWKLVASDTHNEKVIDSYVVGNTSVSNPDEINFINFSNLTQEQIVTWVEQTIPAEELEIYRNYLAGKLDLQRVVETVSLPFPWDQ